MKKNQKDQLSQYSDGKSNQPSAGKERKNPEIRPVNPLPNNPQKDIPEKPDNDNDPTRTDEPPTIFNNQ